MNENQEIDLLKLIKNDIELDFGKKRAADGINKKNKKTGVIFAILGIALILLGIFIYIFFTTIDITAKIKNDNVLNLVVALWFSVLAAGGIFFIIGICKEFASGFISAVNFKERLKNVNLAKYYRIKLSQLTKSKISNLRIESEVIKNSFDLSFFQSDSNRKRKEAINFEMDGCEFSFILVNYPPTSKSQVGLTNIKDFYFLVKSENIQVKSPVKAFLAGSPKYLREWDREIDFEATEFKEFAKVYSSGEISSRKIFTPSRMEKIMNTPNGGNFPLVKNLFFSNENLFSEIGNCRGLWLSSDLFSNVVPTKKKSELAKYINRKVNNVCSDIFYILKYLQTIEAY